MTVAELIVELTKYPLDAEVTKATLVEWGASEDYEYEVPELDYSYGKVTIL